MKFASTVIVVPALLAALAGCASMRTIITDFDLEGSVTLVGGAGAADGKGRGVPAPFEKLARDPRRLSPYPDLRYEDKQVQMTLTVNSDTIHGVILNKSGAPMQLRFDQATMSSNFHPSEVPAVVWSAAIQGHHVHSSKESRVQIPMMRLAAGERGVFTMSPIYASLYPTGRLFDVQIVDKTPELTKHGIGNTLQMRLPIEMGGQRFDAVMDLKALQSSARSSYR